MKQTHLPNNNGTTNNYESEHLDVMIESNVENNHNQNLGKAIHAFVFIRNQFIRN